TGVQTCALPISLRPCPGSARVLRALRQGASTHRVGDHFHLPGRPREESFVMRENAPSRRPPLVLIVSNQEWSSRSLETILAPNGYAVLRAYTAASAMARARGAQPDIIV